MLLQIRVVLFLKALHLKMNPVKLVFRQKDSHVNSKSAVKREHETNSLEKHDYS